MFAPPPGLLGDQEEAVRQQMQMQGLLGLAAGLFQAGTPSRTPVSLGGSALQGLAAGQQAAQGTFDQTLKAMQLRQQMSDAERKRTQETSQRKALESYVATLPEDQRARFMAFPTQAAEAMFRPTKQSIQSIYTPEGTEAKVLFNETTGEYSPIGGAKRESFVQVDRGNVIELRTPSGQVIGTLPKGASPTAPSFTMTETGQLLNTRSGELTQPRDAQGRPAPIDMSFKATEDEKKSAGFYERMKSATQTFDSPIRDAQGNPILRDGKPVLLKEVAEKPEVIARVIGGMLPDWMGGSNLQNVATSSLRQQYEQAQENWVTANLRPESGAVIGPEEMKKEIRKYFPQIGDSEATIRQKEESRKVTQEAIRRRAGRALQPDQDQDLSNIQSQAQQEIKRRQGR